MNRRWERDEDGWRKLPARAWPEKQPNPEQLEYIRAEIKSLSCDEVVFNDDHTTDNGDEKQQQCTDLLFNIATSLVFYDIDPNAGCELYKKLALRGHVDSMVAVGIILIEGFGVELAEEEGIRWLEKAISLGPSPHPQGCYELGVVYYTGIDGIVEENSVEAFRLFECAARQDHTAGLYMTADCLAEGEGTERSVANAIPLFYKAAERGHRFSRQRIRELLAQLDYPL